MRGLPLNETLGDDKAQREKDTITALQDTKSPNLQSFIGFYMDKVCGRYKKTLLNLQMYKGSSQTRIQKYSVATLDFHISLADD